MVLWVSIRRGPLVKIALAEPPLPHLTPRKENQGKSPFNNPTAFWREINLGERSGNQIAFCARYGTPHFPI
jgi:hypothetical protein